MLPPEPPPTPEAHVLEVRLFRFGSVEWVEHLQAPAHLRVGELEEPLIEWDGAGYVLNVAPGVQGEVELEGCQRRLDGSARLRLPIGLNARCALAFGSTTLALRFVAPAQGVRRAPIFDLPYVNTLLLTAAGHVAAVAALVLTPVDVEALNDQAFERVAVITLRAPADPPPTQPKQLPKAEPQRQRAGNRGGAAAQARHPGMSASVRTAVLRMLSSSGGAQQPSGRAGLGESAGRMMAPPVLAPASAPRGFGCRECGGGGARSAEIDTGRPAGRGLHNGGDLGAPTTGEELADLAPPELHDPLPPELIRRVIAANRGQLRYCYERSLQQRQGLEGRVVLLLLIGPSGTVLRARLSESTLGDAAAEACILEHAKRWRFPPPAGGGTVEVRHPFVFRAG